MSFMNEMRVARNAFEAYFVSSAERASIDQHAIVGAHERRVQVAQHVAGALVVGCR